MHYKLFLIVRFIGQIVATWFRPAEAEVYTLWDELVCQCSHRRDRQSLETCVGTECLPGSVGVCSTCRSMVYLGTWQPVYVIVARFHWQIRMYDYLMIDRFKKIKNRVDYPAYTLYDSVQKQCRT